MPIPGGKRQDHEEDGNAHECGQHDQENVESINIPRGCGGSCRLVDTIETLAGDASFDDNDVARHATFNRARIGDWDVFRVYAALWAENIVIVFRGVAVQGKQDRGCYNGHLA